MNKKQPRPAAAREHACDGSKLDTRFPDLVGRFHDLTDTFLRVISLLAPVRIQAPSMAKQPGEKVLRPSESPSGAADVDVARNIQSSPATIATLADTEFTSSPPPWFEKESWSVATCVSSIERALCTSANRSASEHESKPRRLPGLPMGQPARPTSLAPLLDLTRFSRPA